MDASPAVGQEAAVPRPHRTSGSRRALADQVAEPLRRFLATEAGGAGILLAATIAALVWANWPGGSSYDAFWGTELSLRLEERELVLDLHHWVNDGLMVFFFFVIGLEVKRELAMGELTDRRRAAVPVVAAVAGLVVPALVFLAVNPGGEAARAWGVVISMDTAFLLGVLALVGPACPTQLRVFLLTLAVADDVGALTIIALFYTDDLALLPLALAFAGLAVIAQLRRLHVWRGPAYLVVAVGVWLAMYLSGVHPTIAGVLIALLIPVHPPRREEVEDAERLTRRFRQSPSPELARAARLGVDRAVSVNERLQRLYHPYTSVVVVPVFALANAGVRFEDGTFAAAMSSRLTWAVVAGLVVGKLVGITGATALAVRLRLGTFPPGLTIGNVAGGAALSGIGFTVSLFIVDLALEDPDLQDQARIGVLLASVLAASTGWVVFRVVDHRRVEGSARPTLLDPPVDPDVDHVRGPADAPLTLVEFADFECPFCGRATGSVSEVRAHFGDRLRYVYRHLPLTDVHEHAQQAAEASEAAAAQGSFWAMHDLLFARSDALRPEDLLRYAEQLRLDVDRFTDDLADHVHAGSVREHLASAEASGVEGTPTFFVQGRRHTGPNDAATLIAALEAALAPAPGPPT